MSVSSTRSQPLSYTSSSYAPSTVSRRSSYVPTLSLSLPSLPRSLTSRFLQLMDSIYAILAGLSLRLLLSNLSYSNFKVTGTLVGLWEGVITLHFIKKWPKSSDPYLAYFVRLGIDFMFSESSDSVERMVLVIIWTGLGMVLADIAPSIWRDVGLKRVWRRFRRDLYHLTTMVPTVAFFPPTRTVRFSPSRVPSVIEEEDEDDSKSQISQTSPSVIATTELATTTAITPSQISTSVPLVDVIAEPPQRVRRRVPGYFPDDITETESSVSSPPPRVSRRISSNGRTSRRLSVFPADAPFTDEEEEEHDDLDDANISSSTTGSNMTERGAQTDDIDMTRITVDDIPEIQDETTPVDVEPSISEGSFIAVPGIAPGAITIDTGVGMATTKDGETTPRGLPHPFLPPTPSDSAARWTRRYEKRTSASGAGAGNPPPPLGLGLGATNPNNGNGNPDANDTDAQSHHTRPMSAFLPQIPDLETGSLTDNDWHKIQKADLESSNGRAPTPPPKDAEEAAQHNPNVFADNNNANTHVNPANDAQLAALDAALNFVSQPTENQAAPPAYQEPNYMDDDDMYVDDPHLNHNNRGFDAYSAGNEAQAWGVPAATTAPTFNFNGSGSGVGVPAPSFASNNPFSFGPTSSSFTNPPQPTFEEIEARLAAQEAETARLDEKLRAEQERKEQAERQAEEARRLRAEKEDEDRRRQEAEAEDLRRAEEAIRKAEEEMQRAAQEAQEREEEEKEAERRRLEKEERKRKEEADELLRQARIAELQKKEEEERLAREEEEEEARKAGEEKERLEKEAKKERKRAKEERQRKEKEEAARKKKEEEERLKQEEEEKKEKEKQERQRFAQEAAERRAEEAKKKAEQEAKKAEEAEAERKKQEEQAAAEAEAVRKAAEEEEEKKKRLEAEEAAEVEAAKRMAEEEAAHIASIGDAQRAAEEEERQRGEAEAKAAAAREAREKEEEDARLTAESQDLDREIQALVTEEEDADKTQQQEQQQVLSLQDDVQVSTPRATPPPQLDELQQQQQGDGDLVDLNSPVADEGEAARVGEGVEDDGAGGAEGQGAEGGEGGDDNVDDIESVRSDMTNNPASDAGLRLDKMLTTRAQMIQLEAQINELRGQGVDASNARLAKLESVLEKYQRKVVKMYAAGTEMAVFADFEEDVINLESWNEHKSMSKIEERLEKLLSPTSRSLICTITTGPKKNMAGKQRMAVTDTTEYYNLLKYSVEDAKNRKITKINVPENEFGEWLAGYRRLKAERERRAELDQDPWS